MEKTMFENPRQVLTHVEGVEWNPEVPIAKAIQLATEALENYPEQIDLNITLTGSSAKRFHFMKTILTALGLPDEHADKFLLASGVEQQIKMMAERSRIQNETRE